MKRKLSNGDIWHYEDELILKNEQLYQLNHEEGRAIRDNVNNKWVYEYEYRDHLGNLRVSFRDSTAAPVSGVYKPPVLVQSNDYDPWGVVLGQISFVNNQNNINNFDYSNRERQTEFGLNVMALGARMYDPLVARFWSVDPLADISTRFSPYVYGNNNPLRFIDPTGMASEDFTYSDGYSMQSYRNSSGVVGVSGNYTNIVQDGCPPNCGGYGGGDASTPYKAGSNLKPASQQNVSYPEKS